MSVNEQAAKVNCAVLKTCLIVGLEKMKHFAPFFCQELLQYLGSVPAFEVTLINERSGRIFIISYLFTAI